MKNDAKPDSTNPPVFMLIRERLKNDAKESLRNRKIEALSAIRLIIAEQQRVELDNRCELDDEHMLVVLEKMRKQRLDSIEQFSKADRQDLIAIEKQELNIIQSYLPEALDAAEVESLILEAMQSTGACQASEMGKVMAWLRPKVTGRADMRELSAQVKAKLVG